MKGYFISAINNTSDWVAYNNDISTDYKEFLQGKHFSELKLPLYYHVPNKNALNRVKKELVLESSGPVLVRKRRKRDHG